MRLNADIIYEHLSEKVSIQRFGPSEKSLALGRPVFLAGNDSVYDNRVYILMNDRIPEIIPKDCRCLFVCIGQKPSDYWQNSDQSVFFVEENQKLPQLMNWIQDIFDMFDAWDEELRQISAEDADIKKMVKCSSHIFENRIIVVDRNLKVIADSMQIKTDNEVCRSDHKKDSFSLSDTVMLGSIYKKDESKYREPLLFNYGTIMHGGKWTYRVNLFNSGRYEGCVALVEKKRPLLEADYALMQWLANYIKKAFGQVSFLNLAKGSTAKSLLKDLLNAIPVDEYRIRYALKMDVGLFAPPTKLWVCFKVHVHGGNVPVPQDFLRSSLEDAISGSLALVYDGDIVAFCPVDDGKLTLEHHFSTITKLLKDIDFRAGVSDVFSNIGTARAYYRQACVSLELESFEKRDTRFYCFNDLVLCYMLIHCRGEFSYDSILTKGLKNLKEYSIRSSVDYLNTLRVYLNNEMNATKTARDLFLHRSTLLQRLERIKAVLEQDLSDPEERLYLRICLHIPEHTGTL
ncbi:MAG TPA: helix-turn-helix domain-containing protein [Clostridiales bacterium]|nr:helix-turn-helix domain-containing protein [Clostridiales bacterium]